MAHVHHPCQHLVSGPGLDSLETGHKKQSSEKLKHLTVQYSTVHKLVFSLYSWKVLCLRCLSHAFFEDVENVESPVESDLCLNVMSQ